MFTKGAWKGSLFMVNIQNTDTTQPAYRYHIRHEVFTFSQSVRAVLMHNICSTFQGRSCATAYTALP